jgi:hypothetical protein
MPLAAEAGIPHHAAMSELERVLRELARLAGRLGGANDERDPPRPPPETPAEPPKIAVDQRAETEEPPPR